MDKFTKAKGEKKLQPTKVTIVNANYDKERLKLNFNCRMKFVRNIIIEILGLLIGY